MRGSIAITSKGPLPQDRSGVVVWLEPVASADRAANVPHGRARARVVQRGKRFLPGVLAVRTGTAVDFPNDDPIFHNVFSLFEGKRFDLGLYEAGTSRSVVFNRPGISYVFCNIHPEMSAVVVTVEADHHTTSGRDGAFTLPGVPPGRFRLHVWHDRFKPENAAEYPKDVTVGPGGVSLGAMSFVDTGRTLSTHRNKFGQEYIPPAATAIYR